MTRLSQSQWSVWEDICRTNADNIATALSEVTGEMDSIRCALESGDLEALRACFGAANELAAKLRQGREAEEV
jgi:prephenate dehydrogenase